MSETLKGNEVVLTADNVTDEELPRLHNARAAGLEIRREGNLYGRPSTATSGTHSSPEFAPWDRSLSRRLRLLAQATM